MKIKTDKALLSFMSLSEAKVSTFASAVIAALTGNDNFPQAADELVTMVKAQNAYVIALAASKDGSRVQAAEKNVSKAAVLESLRILCGIVNFVAQGDRVMLLGSGFNISKETVAPVVIEPAKNVIVAYGANSGELDITAKGVAGNKGLVFEYALIAVGNVETENVNWISKPSSASRCTLVNLPVGQTVQIRVGIAGARKQLVYTTPVLKLVA